MNPPKPQIIAYVASSSCARCDPIKWLRPVRFTELAVQMTHCNRWVSSTSGSSVNIRILNRHLCSRQLGLERTHPLFQLLNHRTNL